MRVPPGVTAVENPGCSSNIKSAEVRGFPVDEETRKRLEKLFDDDRQRKDRAVAREDERQKRQATFREEFKRVRRETMEPALQEMADFLEGQGWHTLLFSEDEGGPEKRAPGVTLRVSRHSKPTQWDRGGESPHFAIRCADAEEKVYFHESTIGRGHGGSSGTAGAARLDEITPKFVQDKLAKYIEKLMSDSRPYGER
jgi:hypothetical protein